MVFAPISLWLTEGILMQLHIAIAIPTFNRLSYLKKNIGAILAQTIKPSITLSIVIANTASSDGTDEFLVFLQNKYANVFCYNQKTKGENENLKFLSEAIPNDVDWVWLMGDDDYLASEQSVNSIAEVISGQPSLSLNFIHACQARRSKNTGNVISMPVEHLCQELGYHEMLGWYSSVLVTREIFCRAMLDAHNKINSKEGLATAIDARYSAYVHSRFLYQHLHGKVGAFVDLPLVEPQDKGQTKSTQLRWNKYQMGERFLFVVDDFMDLMKRGLLPEKNSLSFFRLVTYSWWDRYFVRLFGEIGDQSIPYAQKSSQQNINRLQSHWKRIQTLANMLDDPELTKALNIRTTHGIELADLYFRTKGQNKFVLESIARHFEMSKAPTYPFHLLNK
jgi:glycosyltransferase involved in cell wall biosynthesis